MKGRLEEPEEEACDEYLTPEEEEFRDSYEEDAGWDSPDADSRRIRKNRRGIPAGKEKKRHGIFK